MKSNTLTSKGTVTIPVEFRQRLQFNTGDEVIFSINENGELVLKKAPSIAELRERNHRHLPKKYSPVTDAGDYFLREKNEKGPGK